MTQDKVTTKNNGVITDKEWLDISWKYFSQHAQQRIQLFNYFIIFSTVLTTGMVTTFQDKFSLTLVRIAIGFLQSFLAIFFAKLDERNSFLIKHAESVIKSYEKSCKNPLFINEEQATSLDKGKLHWGRMPLFTHGQLYRIAYIIFVILGVIELAFGIIRTS